MCIARIERDARTQERLRVASKLRILHFLLHVVYKLLIRWYLVNHKLHIFSVTLQDSVNVYSFSLQGDIKVKKITAFLSLVKSSKFGTQQFFEMIGCELGLASEP